MSTSIVQGSLGALSQQSGKSIAETFLSADVIIIVDTSGSMMASDSRGGNSRYDIACDELRQLQANMPGKVAVINFSDSVYFEPGGVPRLLGWGTELLSALKFVKVADVPDMRFILISDGEPSDPDNCIRYARGFKNRIDVIYVGPEDRPSGRNFLQELSAATGGRTVTADRAKELQASVMQLLGAGQ